MFLTPGSIAWRQQGSNIVFVTVVFLVISAVCGLRVQVVAGSTCDPPIDYWLAVLRP